MIGIYEIKIVSILIVFCSCFLSARSRFKILHICFHEGCINEIQGVADACRFQLVSWNIHSLPPYFFDPATKEGNTLYNMDHQRASRVWDKHKIFFDQFDAIIVSDTTALARIFLQNGWKKPLIIWVTIRCDWCWRGDPERQFPDQEFYDLLNNAKGQRNVFFVASSSYELFYARQRKVDLGNQVIKPCASYLSRWDKNRSVDFSNNEQIFIHKRTEEVQEFHNPSFIISQKLQQLNIPASCYRYHALKDLTAFKGVLYLPYQWCTISFFETLRLGLPTFVPSESFLIKMMQETPYYFEEPEYLTKDKLFTLAEWYHPDLRDIVLYFDSWEDLQNKFSTLDYQSRHIKTLKYGKAHTNEMLHRWKSLFQDIQRVKN
jgi:hypothetical protein